MAIKLYTRSIQLDPRNHVLYSNRAMAYKRSKRYQQALNDAEKSLQLNPDWAKVCRQAIYALSWHDYNIIMILVEMYRGCIV